MSEMKFSKKTITGIIIGLVILIVIIFLIIRGCTNKMYTVTFDSNGGSTVESIKVRTNEKINMPTDPSKSGYEFVGWYYDDKLFDFDTKITKDITLKAHWTKSGVELNVSNINLVVGGSEKIEFSLLPDGLDEEDFIFSSSDKNIVEVDEKGNIKAIKGGTAIITIKSKDGKYETTCKITVTEKSVEIDSVTINGDSSLSVGSSIKLSVKYSPENATSGNLKWESSDNSIAIIDENGVVKGLKAGVVTIKVTTENGKTATKKITVKEVTNSKNNNSSNNKKPSTSGGNTGSTTPSKPSEVLPSSVSISGNSEVYLNETIKLTANVSPSNATNKNVTWSITNGTGSASIDQSGTVRGTKVGTVTVIVRTSNGITSSKQITVKEREAKYDLYLTPITMGGTGGSTQYNYEVKKNGITFTDYIGFYFVDRYIGPGSGTIDADTVNKNGTSSVTLTLKDNKTATMTVHING